MAPSSHLDPAASGDDDAVAEAAELRAQAERARMEAAQLRYELARLRDRRTVRAALALGSVRRSGLSPALAALRGRLPRMDVPGPAEVPLRPPFPHLRVVALGRGAVVAGAASTSRATPPSADAVVRRDRPDLLLVDEVAGYDQALLDALVTQVRGHGGAVVTVGPAALARVSEPDLHVTIGTDPGGAEPVAGRPQLRQCWLPTAVDLRRWAPTGLDEAAPVERLEGTASLVAATARRQPVVVAADPDGPGVAARLLAAAAAGAVPVAPATSVLEAALEGLDAATRELVLAGPGDPAGLEQRAERLLADDDLRRRVSVRLRRQVQARLGTDTAVVRIVTALDREPARSPRISVLLATRRPQRLEQVCRELAAQRHPDVELVLLPHGDEPVPDALVGVDRVQRVPASRPLGAVLNAGLDLATGSYIAKVDDDDRYGPDHLGDQLLALTTSGASLVGRRVHGVYREDTEVTLHPPVGGEERYEDHLPGGTLLLPAEVLRRVRWRSVPSAVDTELVRAVHLDGGSAYSAHRYGYVRVRHGDHTSDAADTLGGDARPGFDPTLLEA